ncbi:hypothetical protein [Azospirillum brasilense]|uniref:hypothetical protein n=1 Tax=Azospirillum brasilense TaxID=192 RepID=UPI001586B5D9|nr:hypothetical protein [Azospirillum brasilense]
MDVRLPRAGTNPRYDTLYDKHVLANWIALIAEDRDLDAVGIASLAGLEVGTAQAMLDGDVRELSVQVLDDALRAVEGRPRCGTLVGGTVAARPPHAAANEVTNGIAV